VDYSASGSGGGGWPPSAQTAISISFCAHAAADTEPLLVVGCTTPYTTFTRAVFSNNLKTHGRREIIHRGAKCVRKIFVEIGTATASIIAVIGIIIYRRRTQRTAK